MQVRVQPLELARAAALLDAAAAELEAATARFRRDVAGPLGRLGGRAAPAATATTRDAAAALTTLHANLAVTARGLREIAARYAEADAAAIRPGALQPVAQPRLRRLR